MVPGASEESYDWRILLTSFLDGKAPPEILDALKVKEVGERGETIRLGPFASTTEAKIILNLLTEMFSSRQAFQNALPYSLEVFQTDDPKKSKRDTEAGDQKEHKFTSAESKLDIPAPPSTVTEFLRIMKNLIPEESWKEFSLDKFLNENGSLVDGKFISETTSKGTVGAIWLKMLDGIVAHFVNVSSERICQAYTEAGKALSAPTEELKKEIVKHDVLASALQECFYLARQFENGEFKRACVHVDILRIYQLLYPPKFSLKEEGGKISIEVSKGHLLSYIAQLARSNILFKIPSKNEKGRGDEKGENRVATPIYVGGRKKVQDKPLIIYLLIDKSSSLAKVFKDLQAQLEYFCSYIGGYVNPQKVSFRIAFFNDAMEPTKEFACKDQKEIREHIAQQTAEGATRLLDSFNEILLEIDDQKLTTTHEVSFVLFTDGKDALKYHHIPPENFKHYYQEEDPWTGTFSYLDDSIPPWIQATFKKMKNLPPKLFILPLGDQVNLKLLENLSSAVEGRCIPLKGVEDFKLIFKHAKLIQFQQELLKIVRGKTECQLSVSLSDDPSVLTQVQIPYAPGTRVEVVINDTPVTVNWHVDTLLLTADADAKQVMNRPGPGNGKGYTASDSVPTPDPGLALSAQALQARGASIAAAPPLQGGAKELALGSQPAASSPASGPPRP